MNNGLKFLDLFAGGGGLSEGFVQAGFEPVAYVERDKGACFTLRTRMSYHWLVSCHQTEVYKDYLNGIISRDQLYQHVPEPVIESIINAEIGNETLFGIFRKVDAMLDNRKLDLIIGGPPCQAYSLVGRSRDQNGMNSDERNYLYAYFARFLERYTPRYFVFENVAGLLSAKDNDGMLHIEKIRALFSRCGYSTEYRILSASDYGVLQNRKRLFLVGRLGDDTGFYPEPDPWCTNTLVEEIFNDLPALTAGTGDAGPCDVKSYEGTWLHDAGIRDDSFPVTWHQARPHSKQDLEIYRIAVNLWNTNKSRLNYNDLPDRLKTHNNRVSFSDRFKVVASDLPHSHTVVAHIAKDGHYYIHPDIEQNRSITPREAARLQTFPDNYFFESIKGTSARTPVYYQIGNAVPVLLARRVAEKLKEVWT